MLAYLKPRTHPLFLDETTNRKEIVLLNIYQNLLVCAIKFVSYTNELYKHASINERFLIRTVN
jgi:hypothetical protein